MYKLLIVAISNSDDMNTLVVDFDTLDAAETALEKTKTTERPWGVQMTATRLYDLSEAKARQEF